ncbi:MAG: FixH family protein [Flavobacteriaceae bacterium]
MARQQGFRITGWMVFWALVAFFGLITAANVALMWFALSTFTGIEAPNAYEAGRGFNESMARAEAQAASGWKAEADIDNAAGRVAVRLLGETSAPATGLAVKAIFRSPVTEAKDAEIILRETEVGRYTGAMPPLPAGNWDVVIEARSADELVFTSVNRALLK